jgi:dTDP-4-dehydrorhamnose reductase
MRIVVLGARGMLGYELVKYFQSRNVDVIHSTRNEPVFKDARFIKFDPKTCSLNALSSSDIIINCIGVVKSIAEIDPIETIKINGVFPLELANYCKANHIQLFHISTDCVYDGKKGNYDEKDPHNALDLYGKSKSIGEPINVMTIRTSIIGEERFGSKGLVEWVKSQNGGRINGYMNHMWNGMTTKQLSDCIYSMVKHQKYQNGAVHLFSDSISKYELVQAIADKFHLNLDIMPHNTDISINRTLKSVHTLNDFLQIPKIRDQISAM